MNQKKLLLSLLSSIYFIVLCLIFIPSFSTPVQALDNPVVTENNLPGTKNWEPTHGGLTFSDDTTKQIKGFASLTSVNKGNPIDFYITSNAPSYTIDIYRIGWYNGNGGRLMQHNAATAGVVQPPCNKDDSTGLFSCSNWAKSYTLNVPTSWTSGIYVVNMITNTNYHDYIIFTVRDDGRVADFLYQQSVTTYQAYNNYPNDLLGGKSLYDFNSLGVTTIGGDKRAVKVSFDRPYASGNTFSWRGHGDGEFFSSEIHTVRWLEKNNYDVTYSTNIDTHANGAHLKDFKAFISSGHDEYYTKQMRDAVLNARDAGVNLAFLGANDIYGQIRLEPNGSVPNRTEVYYREVGLDPNPNKSLETVAWRFNQVTSMPESTIIGIQYSDHDTWDTSLMGSGDAVDYVVNNANNWTYAGTGLTENMHIPRMVGYETDRDMSGDSLSYARPANTSNYTLLSHSPYISTKHNNENDYANSVIYQDQNGAWVFAAGSIYWSWGLDTWWNQSFANPGIQQMAKNIFDKFKEPKGSTSGTATIIAEADTYTDSAAPISPLGGGTTLAANGLTPTQRAFLRFNLAPVAGKTITSATLQINTTAALTSGSILAGTVKFVGNDVWNETYMSASNTVAPSAILDSPVLATFLNATLPNTTYQIPLATSNIQTQINGDGKLSMVIDEGLDNLIFNSKEAATGKPQLILTYGSTPVSTPTPAPAPIYRIFNNPINPFIQTDASPIELGVKFRSTQAGKVLGIRFYKGLGNIGVHTGSLWSSTGTNLATTLFLTETATGWQEVLFPTPVAINANTTYVASYHTLTGHFAQTQSGLLTATTSGPLTALQDGTDGLNGLFLYGVGGFPNQSWNSSNYWVDIIFQ